MKKQNKTSSTPLNWWSGGPKPTIAEFTLTPSSFTIDIKEVDCPTLFKPFTYIGDSTETCRNSIDRMSSWSNWIIGSDWYYGKKTLKVTKKEDIKFD